MRRCAAFPVRSWHYTGYVVWTTTVTCVPSRVETVNREGHSAAHRPRVGRTLAVDVPLGLAVGVLAIAASHFVPAGPGGPRWPPGEGLPNVEAADVALLAYPAIAAVAGGVMLRRLWPRGAFAVSALGAAAALAAGAGSPPLVVGLLLTTYALTAALPPRSWAPWTAFLVPVLAAVPFGDRPIGRPDAELAALLPIVALALVPLALGTLARARREGARREREEELRRSVYEERLRIAREVHDVVGHSLSVISMQAGVALHVLDKQPEQAQPSLEAIRQTSKDALEELRGTLAVFRAPESAPAGERAPLPGLDDVGDLVSAVDADGRSVDLTVEGEPATLPASVDNAAYRIIQEALTNIVRHTGGAGATVRIGYWTSEVAVEISDAGPARSDAAPAEEAGSRECASAPALWAGGCAPALGPRAVSRCARSSP